MRKSAYDRWLKFISGPTYGRPSGIFPSDEAQAIMKACPPWTDRNWRRDKREINKAAVKARRAGQPTRNP